MADRFEVIAGHAEVVAIGHAGKADAGFAGAPNRLLDCQCARGEGKATGGIDKGRATLGGDDDRTSVAIGATILKMRRVLRDARDAM